MVSAVVRHIQPFDGSREYLCGIVLVDGNAVDTIHSFKSKVEESPVFPAIHGAVNADLGDDIDDIFVGWIDNDLRELLPGEPKLAQVVVPEARILAAIVA